MLLLIRYLIENFRTSEDRTWERFFISMNSQMVEEIVPFSKIFAAVSMVAREHASEPACQGICELHLAKGLGVGNVHLLFEGREVNDLAGDNIHLSLGLKSESHANSLLNGNSWIFQ